MGARVLGVVDKCFPTWMFKSTYKRMVNWSNLKLHQIAGEGAEPRVPSVILRLAEIYPIVSSIKHCLTNKTEITVRDKREVQ